MPWGDDGDNGCAANAANQHDINTLAGFDTEIDNYVYGRRAEAGSSKIAATGMLPPSGSGSGTDME